MDKEVPNKRRVWKRRVKLGPIDRKGENGWAWEPGVKLGLF